jgi:hypothetical protein
MTPTDATKKHVISTYVEPARARGEEAIQVRVGNVVKELGWTNRTPSVFSTLSSQAFQREAGIELIEKRDGPPSGGPSTTVQFVYRILKDRDAASKPAKQIPSGQGLSELTGMGAGVFRRLGGGEAYLKAERTWGPDPWEKLIAEDKRLIEGDGAK